MSWGVAPGWYGVGPLALAGGVGTVSWGVAPGWYGSGLWPSLVGWALCPGALPQAGMDRAFGPCWWGGHCILGRCPRLVWVGPLALAGGVGVVSPRRCPRLVWGGPLALAGEAVLYSGALPQAGMGAGLWPSLVGGGLVFRGVAPGWYGAGLWPSLEGRVYFLKGQRPDSIPAWGNAPGEWSEDNY